MELAKTHTKVCYNQSYGVPSSHYGFLKEMPKMCSRGLSLNFFQPMVYSFSVWRQYHFSVCLYGRLHLKVFFNDILSVN
jgi:hypothetical protein